MWSAVTPGSSTELMMCAQRVFGLHLPSRPCEPRTKTATYNTYHDVHTGAAFAQQATEDFFL